MAANENNIMLKCQQRCEHQTEVVTFSTASYPMETFHETPNFCLTLQKLSNICQDPFRAKVLDNRRGGGVTCGEILRAKNGEQLCSIDLQPNATKVEKSPNVTKFVISYAKSNLAVLRLYIKDPYYTLIKRDEQMSLISFIGSIGGLMGLCMGLSLVSLFEIFYHLINFFLNSLKKVY